MHVIIMVIIIIKFQGLPPPLLHVVQSEPTDRSPGGTQRCADALSEAYGEYHGYDDDDDNDDDDYGDFDDGDDDDDYDDDDDDDDDAGVERGGRDKQRQWALPLQSLQSGRQ